MNRYAKLFALLIPVMLFVSACSKDDDPVVPPAIDEADLLVKELLAGGDAGYLNTDCPAIVTAQMVKEDLDGAKKFHLIDVRAKADYDKGHVAGAVNVAIADILTYMKTITPASYDKIVVICYTGQSAAWTTAVLRMSGYNTVFSMKFGMSSWHADFDKITASISSQFATQFTDAVTAKAAAGTMPTINTGKTTGAEILKVRIDSLLAGGYSKCAIAASTVMQDPTQYYIINYWTLADYTSMKHIPGAIQYTPKADLKLSTFLKTLPTNKTIVVYCYTGQTSANVAAILRVLGYDAKSLGLGTQALIHQQMVDAKKTAFIPTDCMNFPYVK